MCVTWRWYGGWLVREMGSWTVARETSEVKESGEGVPCGEGNVNTWGEPGGSFDVSSVELAATTRPYLWTTVLIKTGRSLEP